MVTNLRHLSKEIFCINKSLQHLIPLKMAWRSIGNDNADLINQLEGKYFLFGKYFT